MELAKLAMKTKKILLATLVLSTSLSAHGEVLSLSFMGGIFFSRQQEFREMYGNAYPFFLEARFYVEKYWGISLGWEHLGCQGKALGGEDIYPLRFKKNSIPLALFLRASREKACFLAGAGISRNSYEERWENVDLSFRDRKAGYFAFISLEYFLVRKFSFLIFFKYESLPTGKGSPIVKNVNLGGLRLFLGFSFFPF